MRFLPMVGVAVTLVAAAPALAAPPTDMNKPATQSWVAPLPGQRFVIREAALQTILLQSENATKEAHERKLAELIAQLHVQKDKKKGLIDALAAQLTIKLGQAATFRRQADDRRALLRANISMKPLQDLAIAQDKLIKDFEAGAVGIEAQIVALKSESATAIAPIELEMKRLLNEIYKLQRDEDEERDRLLAEIENQMRQYLEQLAYAQTELLDSGGVLLAKPQRDAATTRASDQLTRVKNIREAIAIGRSSKRPKVAPLGSSRSSR